LRNASGSELALKSTQEIISLSQLRPWQARLLIVLMTLALSVFLLSPAMKYGGTLTVYAQHQSPDMMQVFFPVDGQFNEAASQRSAAFGNVSHGLQLLCR
jgi:hypothetical protein